MQLSKKQNEYIINATHRWNIKSGAVRSGKSYVDTAYIVPHRIREARLECHYGSFKRIHRAKRPTADERNLYQRPDREHQ